MKAILLITFLFSSVASAERDEMSDEGINRKLVTHLKGREVEDSVSQSAQAQRCKEEHKFVSGKTLDDEQIKKAIECFRRELGDDNKKLAELADSLGLEDYGLIKSKNTQEITKFLSNKLQKSLTGIDPEEKDLQKIKEDLKWGKRKIVDQRIFFDLYNTQLQKSALFEVSRFCFENFRHIPNSSRPETTFDDHWKEFFNSSDPKTVRLNFTDIGSKPWGMTDVTYTEEDDKKIQEAVFKSMGNLQNQNKISAMGTFFERCLGEIPGLCKGFEALQTNPTDTGVVSGGSVKGANACLTQSRLQALRKNLAATQKILNEHFDKMPPSQLTLALDKIDPFKAEGENSIDNLTSFTSQDALQGDNSAIEAAEKCAQGNNATDPECDKFIQVGDDYAKAKHNMELSLAFKKEAELARVKKLKENPEDFKKYLEENGYIDLLEINDPNEIEKRLSEKFEAKRKAALMDIENKIGKRQITEAEAQQGTKKADKIKQNAQEVLEEKARLSQVILFNNIVTSQLEVKDKSGKDMGRNISGISKELNSNKDLFQGLQQTVDSQKGAGNNGSLSDGVNLIDSLLGKEPEKKKD